MRNDSPRGLGKKWRVGNNGVQGKVRTVVAQIKGQKGQFRAQKEQMSWGHTRIRNKVAGFMGTRRISVDKRQETWGHNQKWGHWG